MVLNPSGFLWLVDSIPKQGTYIQNYTVSSSIVALAIRAVLYSRNRDIVDLGGGGRVRWRRHVLALFASFLVLCESMMKSKACYHIQNGCQTGLPLKGRSLRGFSHSRTIPATSTLCQRACFPLF